MRLPLFLHSTILTRTKAVVPAPVVVEGVTRAFVRTPRVRDLFFPDKPPVDAWWALRGISFELRRGESLAILGVNGAGKSTLLRILAGALRPTSGTVRVSGSIGRLLSLGAGMIDDLTGVENVRLTLALDGIRSDHVRRVIEFSGIGAAAHRPVRGYSSGMRLRLAYAIAVGRSIDVLIADEVLGVGDEAFQQRCSSFVRDFLGAGGTLAFATHNLYLAEKLCARAIWLDGGRIVADGPCRQVTRDYRAALAVDVHHDGFGLVLEESDPIVCEWGETVELDLVPLADTPGVELQLLTADGSCVTVEQVPSGARKASFGPCLLPGHYRVRVVRRDGATLKILSQRWLVCRGHRRELGSVFLPHRWETGPPELGGDASGR